ncbi:MAG: hypothetical protein Q9P01_13505 [Anaerolineae bacterium]|nr:hypothetical protein [Anaerolineae bacterium]MDQ7035802.1 hypothetical protein [Anaerolineae bacterium]
MSIEILVTLTYSVAALFMMFIFWGISLVATLRRVRFNNVEPLNSYQSKHPNQNYRVVHGPLDEWHEWNKKRRGNTARLDSTVVMPLRYQQPLLFGNSLSDTTKQNATIDTIDAEVKAS